MGALLKSSVARMSGANLISPSLAGHDFWSKWPKKFREAKRYDKLHDGEDSFEDDDDDMEEDPPKQPENPNPQQPRMVDDRIDLPPRKRDIPMPSLPKTTKKRPSSVTVPIPTKKVSFNTNSNYWHYHLNFFL